MFQKKIQQSISDALVSHDFQAAEKMAIEAIKKNKLNAQLWIFLTEALAFQGFGNIARKTLERAWLLDPQATWIDAAKSDIKQNDKGLERSDIDELLKVKDISVCAAMIVKDEESHIENCILHLINAVDEIVIVDTGSTDRTLEILETFEKVKVVKFKWCDDFSAARNAAFPYIRSDWVFWVDADEYLFNEDIKCVREAAALFDSFSIPVLLRVGILSDYDSAYSITSFDAIRLFSMKYGLRYTSKIHEQIVITDENMLLNGAMASNAVRIRLRHFGYMKSEIEQKDKLARNIRLLKQMINEDPSNPLWYFFTGRELFNTGSIEESINYLSDCIKLAQNYPSFGRVMDAYTFLIRAYLEVEQLEEAEAACAEAIKIRTDFPDINYLYGIIKFKKAHECYKAAEAYIVKSKESFTTYRDIVSPDSTLLDWKSDLLHADIALFSSKLSDAQALYKKALMLSPDAVKKQIYKKLGYIQEEKNKLCKLSDNRNNLK